MSTMHTWLRPLLLGLVLGAACDLGDDLEGQPCEVEADCWTDQHCARTPAERTAGLPGVCLAGKTPCKSGAQLGCSCMPDDGALDCSVPALDADLLGYPMMMCEPATHTCVVASDDATSSEG
ncbi:MAG: hypothetical protein K1X88_33175 [Nannocystaceae bacterium]|nr:hypothetical protein [Nannocystaceae bacterium]